MRMRVITWAVLLFAAALWLPACQRRFADEARAPKYGAATHPWELQGWRLPVTQQGGQENAAAAVELPPDIGPQLSTQDTLDPAQLPGIWLQICGVASERMNLILPEDMDELELNEGGQAVFRAVTDNNAAIYNGTWEKTKPGRLRLTFLGGTNAEYYGELFRGEFLYLWDQDRGAADWYARVPLLPSERIMANRFDTQAGLLTITSTVGASYEGEVQSKDTTVRVTGFYLSGIITMRWEDPEHKAGGYAAFHVDKDWNSLYGAVWLDDYKTSPFQGPWDGLRAQDRPAP